MHDLQLLYHHENCTILFPHGKIHRTPEPFSCIPKRGQTLLLMLCNYGSVLKCNILLGYAQHRKDNIHTFIQSPFTLFLCSRIKIQPLLQITKFICLSINANFYLHLLSEPWQVLDNINIYTYIHLKVNQNLIFIYTFMYKTNIYFNQR